MSRTNASSKHRDVYEYLKLRILNGTFSPGQILPSQAELMRQFQVSRITTNSALQILQQEKLVVRKIGVGTFVADPSAGEPELTEVKTDESPYGLIGFLLPSAEGSFGPGLIAAVEKVGADNHLDLLLAFTHDDQTIEQQAIERLMRHHIKGLILYPVVGDYYNPAILQLAVNRFPMVLVDKKLPGVGVSSCVSDNEQGAYLLTRKLIDNGHSQILFYSTDLERTSSLWDRFIGFRRALDESGLAFDSDTQLLIGRTEPSGKSTIDSIRRVERAIQAQSGVTAIFATNERLATESLAAVRGIGLHVPRDISIVCFDGLPVPNSEWNFTRIVQNENSLGNRAVEILVAEIEGERNGSGPEEVVVPVRLEEGHSVAAAKLIANYIEK